MLRGYWNYRAILMDGRPVEDSPAQLAFSAVRVPAGRHTIEWTELVPGLTVSRWGPALFALAAALLLRSSEERKRHEESPARRAGPRPGCPPLRRRMPQGEEPETESRASKPTRRARPREWLRLEPVRLLRDYVRLDTTDEKGEEEGARFLQRFFDCAGIENEIVCPAPKRCNLLARLPGRSRKGALLLLNHIDVVRPSRTTGRRPAPSREKSRGAISTAGAPTT